MATNRSGFATVKLNNVQIPKTVVADGKCELTMKLDVSSEDAMQLANFAYRKAHLKMTLTEFDPELPMPKESK